VVQRRCRGYAAATIALVLLMPAIAGAAPGAVPLEGPQLDAAALRAARGAGPGRALRLVFDVHQGDAAPTPLTVLIGSDYLDIAEAERETLYDFRLRRRLVIDRAGGGFTNLSLYGDVAFRRFDVEKRVALAQMVFRASGGQEQILSLKPFWIETDVGVASGARPRPEIAQETADGGLRFRVDGEEVAFFAPYGDRLSLSAGQIFGRFLRYRLALHPAIVAALEEDGRLPQRLIFVSVAGDGRHATGLVLRRSETIEGDYPLPATLPSLPVAAAPDDPESTGLRALWPVMVDAVAGKSGSGPRSLADYRRAVDVALQAHEGFRATLLLAEMTLHHGRNASDCTFEPSQGPCHTAQELSQRLADDPRVATLYRAQEAEAKDPKEALALWQGLKLGDVAEGYVVDVFIANLQSVANNRAAAAAAFDRALRGNPYLGAVYKDLGDHYLRAGRVDLAWLCYDLGRALPGRSLSGPLATVDAFEQLLAAQYPDFF
jgi:hypothetical protein